MKTILKTILFACISFAIQGCIKVETKLYEEVCSVKSIKPILTNENQTLSANAGSEFEIVMQNYTYYSNNIFIYSPSGSNVEYYKAGATLRVYASPTMQSGKYAVVTKNSEGNCTSDTAFISLQINITEPNCGLADNQIDLYNNGTVYNTNIPLGTAYNSYYKVTWNPQGISSTVTFNFGRKPDPNVTQWYEISDQPISSLGDQQLNILIVRNGSNFYGESGYIMTIPTGDGKIRIKVCDATIYSNDYGYVPLGANMFYQQ